MPLRFRRLVLMLLLVLVPLQGTASVVHALVCVPGEHAGTPSAHVHDGHGHGSHDHGTGHGQPNDFGGGSAEHASHQCCHHFSSAAAPPAANTGDSDVPVFQSSISLLETLFFPEQPQRPPRA